MCDTNALHCDRSHVVTPTSVLLRGHISSSICDPGCVCDCHEVVTPDTVRSTYTNPPLSRRQHPGWRLVTCVYSDRWMGAAA